MGIMKLVVNENSERFTEVNISGIFSKETNWKQPIENCSIATISHKTPDYSTAELHKACPLDYVIFSTLMLKSTWHAPV